MADSEDSEESNFRLRSYQEEMLEASLRENVIVKMDTGTGKTAIAIARTEAALQGCGPRKIVWVLAPTVVLCSQHSENFSRQLPAYQVRLLTGNDGVDRWSDPQTWDAALLNIRIVISTYSVLHQALFNGFVRLNALTLLIFDEVHNCVGDNPGAQLMRDFYWQTPQRPSILGLSASITNPEDFEKRFGARVITPRKCRTELLHHANRPVLNYLRFDGHSQEPGARLHTLKQMYLSYARDLDPWVQSLDPDMKSEFLVSTKGTLCQRELGAIYQKANHIFEQLGSGVTEYFIEHTARSMIKRIDVKGELDFATSMSKAEATHLSQFLGVLATSTRKRKCTEPEEDTCCEYAELSPKVLALIDFLEGEWNPEFTGLIFVQQRALAYTLAHVLSTYQFKRAKPRVEGFVGTSKVPDPVKRLIEQVTPQDHKGILAKFRSAEREVNLIVATEVLGEGVDVPQCHLVLCFDPPPQITSFIQKRGRARQKDSKYVLMFEGNVDNSKIRKWQLVEAALDDAFQKEERLWLETRQLEDRDEPEAEARRFRIASTGALLTHHNATAKMFHLCQTVQSQGWIDARPQFSYNEITTDEIVATVTLPLCFEPELRMTNSSRPFKTERAARRDAVFESLIRLYENGLLNEHLLPLKEEKELEVVETKQKQPSFCNVLPQINPWHRVVSRPSTSEWYPLQISVTSETDAITLILLLPMPVWNLKPFTLYWNTAIKYMVTSFPDEPCVLSSDDYWYARQFTYDLVRITSGSRMPLGVNDFPFLITMSAEEIQFWKDERQRNVLLALRAVQHSLHGHLRPGVVWHDNKKYMLQRYTKTRLSQDEEEVEMVEATTFPKRKDFMHELVNSTNAYTQRHLLPQSECMVEVSTLHATLLSFFVPSILRRVELGLVTQRLQETLMPHLNRKALPALQAAITTREAREAENYERLEFLGDAYINFLTSLHLMVERPTWPEGYLTEEKGKRVSNDTFCKAALRVGLDQFIVSKPFTGQKWTPPYIHKLAQAQTNVEISRVKGSNKRVADVVEATIAVAYLESGHDSALKVCQMYFPDLEWVLPKKLAAQLFSRAWEGEVHLEGLESLIIYNFSKPSLLLEAMTTGAYKGGDRNARSYERLEFLGDAVLDYLVIKRIYSFTGRRLPHHAMHSVKTSIVNAWILGFLCMEHFDVEARENVVMTKVSKGSFRVPTIEDDSVKKHIWHFVRPGTRSEQELRTIEVFQQMHEEIRKALDTSSKYPWPLLCRFSPAKIFSDIIESILGAIYIDSHANDAACDAFLEHIGLYKILNRLLEDDVACMHPKELLGIAADRRKVSYVYGEKEKLITCHVLIDDRQVGDISIGQTREIASTIAAEQVVEIEQQNKTYDMVEKVWKAVSEDKLESVDDGTLHLLSQESSAFDGRVDGNGNNDDDDDNDDNDFDVLAESKKHWKPSIDDTNLFR